jgi:alpha-glucosidase (family GH31 glycosyl hydrolase)
MIMKKLLILVALSGLLQNTRSYAQSVTAAGQPAQLDIRASGAHSIRVTLKPVSYKRNFPENPAVEETTPQPAVISVREVNSVIKKKVGSLTVEVRPNPLTVIVTNSAGQPVQQLVFEKEGNLSFATDGPILGMGEGGPRPEKDVDWHTLKVEYDRRGRFHKMEPRWQSDAYGSRNPVAMLLGTKGWGIFVATPWVQVDLNSGQEKGVFIPWKATEDMNVPQTQKNQHNQSGKGIHPVKDIVLGLYDVFVFDAHNPAASMKDFSVITGKSAMPPKWALGYMQSHRTLRDAEQMIGIVDTFRTKKIPLDAVIYLGTGFAPRGWNKKQPSFEFNTDVFAKVEPKTFFDEMKAKHTNVVLHMVPYDRDKLPTLHGTIPAKPGEILDQAHIQNYWKEHVPLVNLGVAAFWPDEGDWFNLFERIKRHQLYYQGSLLTRPNVRPWSLQRNGFPGIAKWGGWVWSGDTQASWKTLEAQIAVGINYSLSIGPFWGSDTGGFYATAERTGDLYARWFQFSAFCGSFRSHQRTWHLGLPWGWGLNDMGVREDNNDNSPARNPERTVLQSSMNNPAIEPVAKQYDELRYQLMPYNYTLAWQARNEGLPLMRAMWLHYPKDATAAALGNQYLWGRDMLIAPVYEKGATSRSVYLPEGLWYDWWTNKAENGKRTVNREVDLSIMPIYVRAGAIIPFDPIRQYAMEPVTAPTTLKIYSGNNGEFTLYEDDGISLDYLKGKETLTKMVWNDKSKKLTITPGAGSKAVSGSRTFKVQLLPEGTVKEITYSGKPTEITMN